MRSGLLRSDFLACAGAAALTGCGARNNVVTASSLPQLEGADQLQSLFSKTKTPPAMVVQNDLFNAFVRVNKKGVVKRGANGVLKLARFRGYFPLCGEGIHHGQASPLLPSGLPA
jgi:hypothetical protein